jgi:Macrocin-O-methyltransferase (TylF)
MKFFTVEDTFPYLAQLPTGSLLEFGTYHGDTLSRLIKGCIDNAEYCHTVWAFDSWTGLPKEADGVWCNKDWPEGAFSTQKDCNLSTDEECMKFVVNRARDLVGEDIPLIEFISGYFEDTLMGDRGEDLGSILYNCAMYCHIDVDLYISTKQVLDWLFINNVPRVGCAFRFDDWNSTPLYKAGNSLAFLEATNKYGILWTPIGCNFYIFNGYLE